MLSWASRFSICCFLDNHEYQLPGHSVECLLAVGAIRSVRADAGDALDQLRNFAFGEMDWLFGHFAYGLSKETEPGHWGRQSKSGAVSDRIGFPDLFFFVPEILIELSIDHLRIGSCKGDQATILEQIVQVDRQAEVAGICERKDPATLQPRFTKDEYLRAVEALQLHILRGDCYEINFCQEFFAQPAILDPLATWFALSQASPNPFAAFYKLDESYLLCASPERYLKREGDTLLAQPIKGTAARAQADGADDRAARNNLYHSAKDRAENVMIVDLVRNDLSKICLPGSVIVQELYGIYSFPRVHQMISSVTGKLPSDIHWTEVIRSSFPMGSMTGAPKRRVVELIGEYERSVRGLFSGAVGYISPGGDFDFNVVIRSIQFNSSNQYLSYQVGSGITFYSNPLAEYEECLLKAQGILQALSGGGAWTN